MPRVFLLLILLSISYSETDAQSRFYRTVGTSNSEEGNCVASCADGGYFLSFSINHLGKYKAALVKTTCAGELKWSKAYELVSDLYGYDIFPMPDSGCIFIGYAGGSVEKTAVMRVDKYGNLLQTFQLDFKGLVKVGGVTIDSDGNLYFCGSHGDPGPGYRSQMLTKIKSGGDVAWTKIYSEQYGNAATGICMNGSQELVVIGTMGFVGGPFTDILVMRCDTSGNQIARRLFGTTYDDDALSITSGPDHNLYITGNSYFMGHEWDVTLLKLDSVLQFQMMRFYDAGTPQGEYGRSIIHTNDGALAIVGDAGDFNERNPMLMKIGEDGTIIWSKQYPVSTLFTNYLFSFVQTSDGGFMMTGDIRPPISFRDPALMKTDNNGDLSCHTTNLNYTFHDEVPVMLDSLAAERDTILITDFTPAIVNDVTLTEQLFCDASYPCPAFENASHDTLCPKYCFDFVDSGSNATSWNWSFPGGNPSSSTDQNPSGICYTESGSHSVSLVSSNATGSASVQHIVQGDKKCPVILPNVLTPDGNNLNDRWIPKGLSGDYSFKVYNRWGKIIFQSDHYSDQFKGETSEGNKLTPGVYYYLLEPIESGDRFRGVIEIL